MTEFYIEQDRDPELVEDELVDEQEDVLVDLPDYDSSLFELQEDEDFDINEVDEEEDGEPE